MYNSCMISQQIVDKLDTFFKKYPSFKFEKGSILIRAGDDPPGIFYLQQGKVRQYTISKQGDEQTLNIYKPISFFPMMWAINDTHNLHYFEAMTPVSIFRAPKEDVLTFVKKEPDVMFDLLRRLYKGMEGLLIRMEYLLSGNAYAKLITILLISARRFGVESAEGTRIELRHTEKDLATQAGISRETVSREIQILKNKGLLVYNRKSLIISDIAKLEEELFGPNLQ